METKSILVKVISELEKFLPSIDLYNLRHAIDAVSDQPEHEARKIRDLAITSFVTLSAKLPRLSSDQAHMLAAFLINSNQELIEKATQKGYQKYKPLTTEDHLEKIKKYLI